MNKQESPKATMEKVRTMKKKFEVMCHADMRKIGCGEDMLELAELFEQMNKDCITMQVELKSLKTIASKINEKWLEDRIEKLLSKVSDYP